MSKNELNSPNHLTIVNFRWLADTKGAVRYQEIDDNGVDRKTDSDGAIVGSLYLRKAALGVFKKGTPKTLSMHIDIKPET